MAVDFWLCLATLLTLGVLSQGQERYAPGVPPPQPGAGDIKFHDPNDPSQYQQNQPPQHHQQQNQHNQQQQNQHHQGQQQHGGGHHHDHQFGEKLDQEHLEKHKEEKYVDTSKMTERERIWYQFKQFDMDKDGKVDGIEIIKYISHMRGDHGEKVENNDGTTGAPSPAEINMTAEELENFSQSADEALKIYDTDNDGYISFREFFVVMNKEQDEAEKNKNQQQT